MKIIITDAVKDFLKNKKLDCITLDMAKSSMCCGSTSMPNIGHVEPSVPSKYDLYKIDDVNIYLWKGIAVEEELKFILKSFFSLKYVEVNGIKLI